MLIPRHFAPVVFLALTAAPAKADVFEYKDGQATAQVAADYRARLAAPDAAPLVASGYLQPPADLRVLIDAASTLHGVDARLVTAVMAQESAFDPLAVSPKVAQGLMQLMPATATALGVRDPFAVSENIDGGVRYLSQMLDRYGGDYALALAAYNAGPDAVDANDGIPPYVETVTYVARITQRLMAESVAAPVAPAPALPPAPPAPLLVYSISPPPAPVEAVADPAAPADQSATAAPKVPSAPAADALPAVDVEGLVVEMFDAPVPAASPLSLALPEEEFDITTFVPPPGMVTVVENGKAVR